MYPLLSLAAIWSLLASPVTAQTRLNITAVGVRNSRSTLECWQLDEEFAFTDSTVLPNTLSATFGGLSNLTYTIIPPKYDAGVHNAPANQWVIFAKGIGRITLPEDDTSFTGEPGKETGIVFASDTVETGSRGHGSEFPGSTESILLQIPTQDNKIPGHSVLHMGPCEADELDFLRTISGALTNVLVSLR